MAHLPVSSRPTFLTLLRDVDAAGHNSGLTRVRPRRPSAGWTDIWDARTGWQASTRWQGQYVVVSDHGNGLRMNRVVVGHYLPLNDVDIVGLNPTLGPFQHPGAKNLLSRR
jgi:hypothetical protein